MESTHNNGRPRKSRPNKGGDTRKPWEKRRDERLLKYRKEQFDRALASFNSTKHISPSDVRALNRKALLDLWEGVSGGDNSLDKNAVLREIKRRAKKISIEGVTDPVELLRRSIAEKEAQKPTE